MDLRKKRIEATLVFPIEGDKVLLAKKTKKIGIGLWNGWGGGIEENETKEQAAIRELFQESGLIASFEDLSYQGKMIFHNQKNDGRKFDVEVYMFLIQNWSGEIKSNFEMKEPTWWPISNLPFHEMMPSDKDWLPHVLAGEVIEGEVWHGLDQKEIIQPSEIKRVG